MARTAHYAVRIGRVPGIYPTWAACRTQVDGFPAAAFKKFTREEDAQRFIDYAPGQATPPQPSPPVPERPGVKRPRSPTQVIAARLAKRPRVSSPAAARPGHTVVWTDGACSHNGTARAVAGVGVYFGRGDARNCSEALAGRRQTNQRAELTAAIRALEIEPEGPLEVRSDSMYVVNGATCWIHAWRRSKWTTCKANGDLWQQLDRVMRTRTEPLTWTHVRGHAGIYGNEQADALAVQGAHKHKHKLSID